VLYVIYLAYSWFLYLAAEIEKLSALLDAAVELREDLKHLIHLDVVWGGDASERGISWTTMR
jgi:hypothetical protein